MQPRTLGVLGQLDEERIQVFRDIGAHNLIGVSHGLLGGSDTFAPRLFLRVLRFGEGVLGAPALRVGDHGIAKRQ